MKKVALTLGSGGARGLAHIGAIQALMEHGYEISSISGCSIGSLIGGIYAAGKISEAKDWFCSLDARDVLSLTDFSLGMSHVVKGERVLRAIQEWVPDRKIEDLPIPVALVATDLIHSEPVVFHRGSLFDAIRASISIPMCFEPVQYRGTLLVDGGLVDPLPLDMVRRTKGDILVGINISGRTQIDRKGIHAASLINRTIDIQIQAMTQLMIAHMHPQMVMTLAQDAYTTFDFYRAGEIIERGRELMESEIERYEGRNC